VGDSGSLVIDTITGQPCGYVVAVNRFQELYVIPLCLAVQQIAEMVSAPNVRPEVFLNLQQIQRPVQAQQPVNRVLMTNFSQTWSQSRIEERRPAWLRKLRAKCVGGWGYVQTGVLSLLLPTILKLSTRYRLSSHKRSKRFSQYDTHCF
jgi:hypothetical protein